MSRAVLLGALVLLLILAGLAGVRGALLALAMPLLIYLFYGLWLAPERIDLDVRREMSAERVAPQAPVRITVTVMNQGNTLDELALEDVIAPELQVVDGSNRHLISLGRFQTFSFEYTVRGPRGGFPFENVHAEGSDSLGLVRLTRDLRVFGQLFVLPNISRIRHVPIQPRR